MAVWMSVPKQGSGDTGNTKGHKSWTAAGGYVSPHQPKHSGYANMIQVTHLSPKPVGSLLSSPVAAGCMPASPCRDASHDYSSRLSESLSHQILSEWAGNKHAEMLKQQLSDETIDCTYINNPSDINHWSHLGLRWIQLQPHSSLNLETQWKGFPGSFVWACPLCITHRSVLYHLTLLNALPFTMEFC